MNEFESQLRKAMEDQDPIKLDRRIWLDIKDQVSTHHQRRIRLRRIRWIGAAASVLLAIGLSFFFLQEDANKEQLVIERYGLQQHEFPKQVEQRLSALTGTRIPASQVEQFNALKSQLYFLDQQYQNYLEYIEQNGYQEFIGKQIQNYYEVKIELLETIQKEIEKLKLKKNDTNQDIQEVGWQI